MPTLQELIEERRKKRLEAMADTVAVSDATSTPVTADTTPKIRPADFKDEKPSAIKQVAEGNKDVAVGAVKGIFDQPFIGQGVTPHSMAQNIQGTRALVESIPHVGRAIMDVFKAKDPQLPGWDVNAAKRSATGGALTAAMAVPMITGATAGLKAKMSPRPSAATHVMPSGEVMAGATHPAGPQVSPRVAAALRTTMGDRAKSTVSDAAHRVRDGFGEAFEYGYDVRDFPELIDDVHVFKSTSPAKAVDAARGTVVNVIKDLDRQSYLQFQDMVNLRDARMTAAKQIAEGKPVRLSAGMTLEEVDAAIAALEPQMSPQAKAALQAHGEIVTRVGQGLVERGLIPKESVSTDYFPHQVMSYLGESADRLIFGGKKLKEPSRGYTMERKGSEKPIETDYRRAMLKYLTAYEMDNMTSDFMRTQVKKFDISESLAVPDENGMPRVPRNAIPDGYVEYIPDKANIVRGPKKYPIENPNPLEKAMFEALDETDGSANVRPDASIIPVEIANKFSNFGPDAPPSLIRAVNKANGLWKAWTIGAGGVKFTVFQLTGDALNLYRADARAFGSGLKAFHEQVTRGPLYQASKEQGVVNSGFVGKEVPDILAATPELTRVGSPLEKLQATVYKYNPLRFYRDFQIERENYLRLTKFVADMDRGIDPKTAGKAAREFTVDYGRFTPQENTYIRGFLAPFYAFAKQNTANWSKYAAQHPTEFTAKFIVPYFAASLWNEEKYPEAEKKIPAWMKDQLYVILKANDSTATVLTFATPLDDAVRKFGLAHPRKLFEQLANTQLPGFEADTTLPTGLSALKEVPGEAVKEWANMLNPAIKLPIELASNYSIFSGRPIERVGERTLPDSMKTQTREEYALGSLFRPYREVTMFKDAANQGKLLNRLLPVYEVDLRNPFAGKEFTPQEEVFNQWLRAMESGDEQEMQRLMLRHGGTISPKALTQYLTLYMIQKSRAQQRMQQPLR